MDWKCQWRQANGFYYYAATFSFKPRKTNALRIFLTQNTLPNDKESLFWLNIKTIPATEKKTENSLKIAFKTQMKLIYRPSAISNVDFAEEQKINVVESGYIHHR